MGPVEDPGRYTFWERVAFIRIWLLVHSRPQFHYAVEVLYQAAVYGSIITLIVLVFNLFGLGYFVDFQLLAHFVGPLGAGALVAGVVRLRIPDGNRWRGWIVAAAYGGVTVMVFALLMDFSFGAALIGFSAGVAFFGLLHCLYELEARKNRAA